MDPRSKKEFVADFDYEFDEKHKTVSITEQGVAKAESFLGIDHLYRAENGHLVNHLIQSLKAESLYKRDVDYAVIDGEVKIIDEFTGRILEGRRWSEGLHQAIEAKEGVRDPGGEPDARDDHAPELLPPVRQARGHDRHGAHRGDRVHEDLRAAGRPDPDQPARWSATDRNDQVYKTKDGKWSAVVRRDRRAPREAASRCSSARSPSRSPSCSASALKKRGITHTVLNAKPEHAEREGETIAEAGQPGRRHDRHQHGRPRRRHQARRQPRAPRAPRARASSASSPATPTTTSTLRRGAARDRGARRGGPRAGARGRRPVHLRHRAPRVAAHRQPAARPLRPPGRPRRVALLPVRRGRPRAPVRRRPHLQDPRPPRRRPTRRATRSRSRPGCSRSRSRRRRRRSRSRTS